MNRSVLISILLVGIILVSSCDETPSDTETGTQGKNRRIKLWKQRKSGLKRVWAI